MLVLDRQAGAVNPAKCYNVKQVPNVRQAEPSIRRYRESGRQSR